MRTRWACIGIVAAAPLAFLLASAIVGESEAGPQARQAREFAFEDINPASATHGETLALSDLYADSGVVLQFVASWCKPCRDELPELQALHAMGPPVPIVLIAADEYGYTEGVLLVAEGAGVTAPILFVPRERTAEMEVSYDHDILPSTYLIDRRGAIREVHQGAWSAARLRAAVERRLQ
jgi:thiol-disulfide isomerase/thioredoxin